MLTLILSTLVTISAFILQALCLLFAVMAYRKSVRKGYLLIVAFLALYFLLPLAQPLQRKMAILYMEHHADAFAQKMAEAKRVDAEINKAIGEIYKREGITVLPAGFVIGKQSLNLRLDLLLLAFGLWSLQASERPKHKATDGGT